MGWLIHYEAATPGVETADNSTARLDLDNEPQPDAVLLIDPAVARHVSVRTIVSRTLLNLWPR
jgi:hypothetical protein